MCEKCPDMPGTKSDPRISNIKIGWSDDLSSIILLLYSPSRKGTDVSLLERTQEGSYCCTSIMDHYGWKLPSLPVSLAMWSSRSRSGSPSSMVICKVVTCGCAGQKSDWLLFKRRYCGHMLRRTRGRLPSLLSWWTVYKMLPCTSSVFYLPKCTFRPMSIPRWVPVLANYELPRLWKVL